MTISYPTWLGAGGLKAYLTANNLNVQRNDEGAAWYAFCIVDGVMHETRVFKDGGSEDLDLAAATANKPIQPRTATGEPLMADVKIDASRKTTISHDWCDKTTWYGKSVRVVDEVATDSGDHTVYTLAHQYVIDIYHGKLVDEEYLKDASNNSYRVTVKVDDVAKTEQDPHYGENGDFTINYATGEITFLTPLAGTEVVKVTYYYATNSIFTLKPDAGKTLTILFSEIQFAKNVVAKDTIRFRLFVAGYPYGNDSVFKGMRDFFGSSARAYPVYPAIGGTGWRSLQQDVITLDWDYQARTDLKSAYAMEVQIYLEHDTPWEGEFATATFYCTQK